MSTPTDLTAWRAWRDGLSREWRDLLLAVFVGSKIDLHSGETLRARVPLLRKLDVGRVVELRDAKRRADPKAFPSTYPEPVVTVEPLRVFSAVRDLSVEGLPVEDVEPLAVLENLTRLNISRTRVGDVAPLARLKKLRTLLAWCTPMADAETIAHLPALEELHIQFTGVRDLSPLSALSKLAALDICGTAVTDLTPLAKLPRLSALTMYKTKPASLWPLWGLPLKRLGLEAGSVPDRELAAYTSEHPGCSVGVGGNFFSRRNMCGCPAAARGHADALRAASNDADPVLKGLALQTLEGDAEAWAVLEDALRERGRL